MAKYLLTFQILNHTHYPDNHVVWLKAKTAEQALELAKAEVLKEFPNGIYGGTYENIVSVRLAEVTEEIAVPLKDWASEFVAEHRAQAKKRKEEEERGELHRLLRKFGGTDGG